MSIISCDGSHKYFRKCLLFLIAAICLSPTYGLAASGPRNNSIILNLPPNTTKARSMGEVMALYNAIYFYRKDTGHFPPVDNRKLVASLRGNNPQKRVYLESDVKLLLDSAGNIIDASGLPISFDFSKNKLAIVTNSFTVSGSILQPWYSCRVTCRKKKP
jgi:hypothetical protein